MSGRKKILCIILSGLAVVAVGVGMFFCVNFQKYSKTNYKVSNFPVNADNYVNFRKDVHIADDSAELQKNYDTVRVDHEVYTIVYENEIPEFFKNLKLGDIFCAYPDSSAAESFFALGFCGRLTTVSEDKDGCLISFTLPKLTDVFSDIYINTNLRGNLSEISMAFYPSENITEVRYPQAQNVPSNYMCAAIGQTAHTALWQSSTIGLNASVGYQFKESETASLLEDYVLVCEELDLKFDCDVEGNDGGSFDIEGDVCLEEIAVKMLLDYHYDEGADTVEINDYSLGFMAKQKVALSLSAEQTIGLDDIGADLSDVVQIISIEDVTESEKGKIVLGTYLIGWEAALPILQNDTNKVSYLSLGIAVQLSLTGKGELSLEYSIEESGFVQIEVNGNGENTYFMKGYDYPNPVKESREPTEEEAASVPCVTSEVRGEVSFDLAIGADIGVCILGMIPIKLSNNLLELEMTTSFIGDQQTDEIKKVINHNYLVDDSIDSVMISSGSQLKMHLGAKINGGFFEHTIAEMGGAIQLFKKVWYQYPSSIGFSHSQCGFGGIFVGETYSDQELAEAFKAYMKDTDQDGIVAYIKDSLFGSLVNAAFNDWGFDLLDIAAYLGKDVEHYKFNYYTSGIIYVRDESDRVVAAFVIGEDVANMAGVHNGLSERKIEQIYSSPGLSAEADINVGWLARKLFGLDWIKNVNFSVSTYDSCDSAEQMVLLFCDDALKMIIIKN